MKKLQSILLLILSCLALFTACSDDDCSDPRNESCSNFNPCLDTKPTRAGFKVEESLRDYWIECDTVSGAGNVSAVRFTANQDCDEYIWRIGAETIKTKSFIRNFFPSGEHIKVQLVTINHNPNTACFPNDNGMDTMTRMIYTRPEEKYWGVDSQKYIVTDPMPVSGVYRGTYQSNPNEEVEIIMHEKSFFCFNRQILRPTIKNIPADYIKPAKASESCGYFSDGWIARPTAVILQYSTVPFEIKDDFEDEDVLQVNGILQLSRDLKRVAIEIEYSKYPFTGIKVHDVFIGIKIK